ncbi:glycosyltransferase family protein [Mucilaginibacter myungsuensis]|uniref:Glycosyl transferase n=1 Tax=Mucilaginibacter myungsuensis TaxID=649104 RepID=A0A929PWE7_9SPHI|nr:glycosyltransferase family protein [Mucilaginibacter myungsuensis]MBE9662059.1 glycosyl transferase [Mucilaginibacter myungsuensis]MDN3599508.1 glycosyltransferase family protein [Mucilaginibacter myungsuensis]
MKILYAIQGTGNGHLSRSMDIVPLLQKYGQVDVVVSGVQGDLKLPFPVKYQFHGLGFIFGKSGGVDLLKSFYKAKLRLFLKEIQKLPVEDYDLVINDFEPVTSWACYLKNKFSVGLSHQAAVVAEGSPKADDVDVMGKFILEYYSPASVKYGFHFNKFDDNMFTPVIRQQVRDQVVSDQGHYTVYLPAYDDSRLIKRLSEFKDVRWEVFSKHNKKVLKHRNVHIQPINNQKFIESMAGASGILCGAGFETPAEALYMKKKLLVIPMKSQYEQHLNAAALKQMGVPVIKSLKEKHFPVLSDWIENGKIIGVDYPNETADVINMIIKKHGPAHSA